jgi:hypothetical protein
MDNFTRRPPAGHPRRGRYGRRDLSQTRRVPPGQARRRQGAPRRPPAGLSAPKVGRVPEAYQPIDTDIPISFPSRQHHLLAESCSTPSSPTATTTGSKTRIATPGTRHCGRSANAATPSVPPTANCPDLGGWAPNAPSPWPARAAPPRVRTRPHITSLPAPAHPAHSTRWPARRRGWCAGSTTLSSPAFSTGSTPRLCPDQPGQWRGQVGVGWLCLARSCAFRPTRPTIVKITEPTSRTTLNTRRATTDGAVVIGDPGIIQYDST